MTSQHRRAARIDHANGSAVRRAYQIGEFLYSYSESGVMATDLDTLDSPVFIDWVKVGNIYHVLAIWSDPTLTRLRFIGEQRPPALYEPKMFEVVSPTIPKSWTITSPKPGCLSLAPAAWQRPGFWEDYFEMEPAAMKSFEEERQRIIDDDP